jgi:CheY-like chemotaxis protein
MDIDSTNRSTTNDQQQARLRMAISRFLDQTSHDFRTPLTIIKEFATLMRDGLVGEVNKRQCDYLDIINDRADELTAMFDNVLDAGKLQAGVFRLWRQPTSVAEVVETLAPLFQRKAASKGTTCETAVEPDLPTVYADQDQLPRILNNLLSESLSAFTQPDSVCVWAKAEPEHGNVQIGVTVRGGQIAPHRLAGLRQATLSGHATDAWTEDLAELGLLVASRLIRLHLAQLRCEQSDDGTATLSFELPCCEPLRLLDGYLHRAPGASIDQHVAGLVSATVNPRVKAVVAKVVDEFIQQWTGPNDLAVQVEKHRWLVLVQGDRVHTSDWIRQVEMAWSETLDARPGGLLPRLEWTALGQWAWARNADELRSRFRAETAPTMDPDRRPAVLLVDDDTAFAEKAKSALEAIGYDVLTASDGQVAVDMATESLPDAVIVDSHLPTMDGMSVLACLQDQPSTSELPVIFASVLPEEEFQALEMGARFYLKKPVAPSLLADVLGKVIDPPTAVARERVVAVV